MGGKKIVPSSPLLPQTPVGAPKSGQAPLLLRSPSSGTQLTGVWATRALRPIFPGDIPGEGVGTGASSKPGSGTSSVKSRSDDHNTPIFAFGGSRSSTPCEAGSSENSLVHSPHPQHRQSPNNAHPNSRPFRHSASMTGPRPPSPSPSPQQQARTRPYSEQISRTDYYRSQDISSNSSCRYSSHDQSHDNSSKERLWSKVASKKSRTGGGRGGGSGGVRGARREGSAGASNAYYQRSQSSCTAAQSGGGRGGGRGRGASRKPFSEPLPRPYNKGHQ